MLNTELHDGILTITINRPERRNALSVAISNALTEQWERVDRDDAVRVVILTSADCGTFSAGMDLKEAAEIAETQGIDVLTQIRDAFDIRVFALEVLDEFPITAGCLG